MLLWDIVITGIHLTLLFLFGFLLVLLLLRSQSRESSSFSGNDETWDLGEYEKVDNFSEKLAKVIEAVCILGAYTLAFTLIYGAVAIALPRQFGIKLYPTNPNILSFFIISAPFSFLVGMLVKIKMEANKEKKEELEKEKREIIKELEELINKRS